MPRTRNFHPDPRPLPGATPRKGDFYRDSIGLVCKITGLGRQVDGTRFAVIRQRGGPHILLFSELQLNKQDQVWEAPGTRRCPCGAANRWQCQAYANCTRFWKEGL